MEMQKESEVEERTSRQFECVENPNLMEALLGSLTSREYEVMNAWAARILTAWAIVEKRCSGCKGCPHLRTQGSEGKITFQCAYGLDLSLDKQTLSWNATIIPDCAMVEPNPEG